MLNYFKQATLMFILTYKMCNLEGEKT